MTAFENNLSPYLTIVEATEPAAPSAGQQRIYIDSTTHLLKATNSSGTDRTIEGVAAGAITTSGLTQATAKMLGRSTASTGAIEEITVGTGLTLSAGTLSAPAGGLAFSQLGYTTAGGSQETMVQYKFYTKTITLASAGVLLSVSAHFQGLASQAEFLRFGVWSDNSGSPQYVQSGSATNFYLQTAVADGTARWVSGAMGRYLASGTYWIGVMCPAASAAKISYDGSGSDKYWTASIDDITDAGSIWTINTSANKYSIYADILS